jgi:hypothetical protein
MYQKAGLVQGDDMSNVFYGATLIDAINSISNDAPVINSVTSTDANNSDAIIAKIIVKIDELEALKKALISSKNNI